MNGITLLKARLFKSWLLNSNPGLKFSPAIGLPPKKIDFDCYFGFT